MLSIAPIPSRPLRLRIAEIAATCLAEAAAAAAEHAIVAWSGERRLCAACRSVCRLESTRLEAKQTLLD